MSAITAKRAQLRREARERQKVAVPKLRALVKARRIAKRKRIAKCRADCKRRREALKRDAVRAREKLRERIRKARETAKQACGFCKVTATDQELDKLDRALAAVQAEREAIADLRSRAGRLKDARGSAGGRRAAELRAESDDEVKRNVEDDPDLAALWQTVDKGKFRATADRNRTEAFLEWVHDHPEALDELRSAQQAQYDREAEELFARWPRDEAIGRMDDHQLAKLMADLELAEQVQSPAYQWLIDEPPF